MCQQIGQTVSKILGALESSAFMDRAARTRLQLSGGDGSGATNGTRGARSPSGNRSRVPHLSKLFTASHAMPASSVHRISVTSLVQRKGEKVEGCTCTPYCAASRGTLVRVHTILCAGTLSGGGGSTVMGERNSSRMIQPAGQLDMWLNTSQKPSESTNV